jgi:hypothetical protein
MNGNTVHLHTTMLREGGITPISTVEQGGAAILHLAAGEDVAGKGGLFFNGMRRRRPMLRLTTMASASGCARSALN